MENLPVGVLQIIFSYCGRELLDLRVLNKKFMSKETQKKLFQRMKGFSQKKRKKGVTERMIFSQKLRCCEKHSKTLDNFKDVVFKSNQQQFFIKSVPSFKYDLLFSF